MNLYSSSYNYNLYRPFIYYYIYTYTYTYKWFIISKLYLIKLKFLSKVMVKIVKIFFCRFRPLLKKRKTQYKKWSQKLFTGPLNVIWFGILLLGVVYVLYTFMNNDIQSDSSNVPKVSPINNKSIYLLKKYISFV